jgi:hypothetical protein
MRSSRFFAPKGLLRIAWHFKAGGRNAEIPSPFGTAEIHDLLDIVSRPCGTGIYSATVPGVETPGYSRQSLRDNKYKARCGFAKSSENCHHNETSSKFGTHWSMEFMGRIAVAL